MSCFLKSLSLVVVVLALSACMREKPIYNVDNNAIAYSSVKKLSAGNVRKLITKAARSNRWIVQKIRPGMLRATLRWRSHEAQVNIAYSSKNYSITYASSQNLLEKDGMIHRKYNQRVMELRNEIDRLLSNEASL